LSWQGLVDYHLPAVRNRLAYPLALAAVTCTLAAQSRDPIRVATRLVQVHVVVHDKDRQPVRDLTQTDFRLSENGREQTIALFDVEADAPRADAAPAAPAAPNVFTNDVTSSGSRSATIVLIDRLNTTMVDQAAVRNQALRFLSEIRPGDRVGLYMLDNGDAIHVLHDFTADAESLIRALARFKPRTGNEVAAAEDVLDTSFVDGGLSPELLAWAKGVETNRRIDETRDRVQHTNAGLETIARRLAGVRGRKNLIWISSAFPITLANSAGMTTSLAPDLNSGLLALNDANVSVYPVDARRLVGAFATPPAARNQQFTTLSTVRGSIDALQLVAGETGGRAFFNTNDLTGAMRRAIDDGRVTYVLGYYPAHNTWNGQFRRLKVEVGRRGVDVRHRRGYIASAAPVRDQANREAALKAAVEDPLESTAIGLTVHVERETQNPPVLTLTTRIDPRGLALERQGDRWQGQVDLLIAQASAQGALAVSGFTTLTLDLTTEQRDRVLRDGLVIPRAVTLTPGAHQLRVVGRDTRTGATGTLIVPIEGLLK
jgi:VWFA-related protein